MRVFALDPETGAERWVFDPGAAQQETRRPVSADVPRCRLLGGEGAATGRSLFASAPLRHARLGADRARRRHGPTVRRLRRARPRRAARGDRRLGARLGVLPDVSAARDRRHRGARRARRRSAEDRRAIGRRARVRRAQRADRVGVGPGAAGLEAGSARRRASSTSAARRTCGRCSRAIPSAGSCSCPRAIRRRTASAACGAGSTTSAARRSRSTRRPGRCVWHFQTVHHDIWDYDIPAQPQLFQHPKVGGGRPAVIQPTKVGHVFILDRETGAPLYPVEERPAPQDGAPGETLAPTQPFPTHPASLHPTELTPENMFGFTPWDTRSCRDQLARYRYDGPFTPPTVEGSIQYAGHARRHELGRGGARSGERAHDRQPVASRGRDEARAARGVRRDGQGRGGLSRRGLPDARHALRRGPQPVLLELRRAVQPAAVGVAHGRGSRDRRGSLARAARHDPRPGAVPDLGDPGIPASRRAELRGRAAHRERRLLHRRHERQVLPRVRRRHGRGDLAHADPVHRQRHADELPAAPRRAAVRRDRGRRQSADRPRRRAARVCAAAP